MNLVKSSKALLFSVLILGGVSACTLDEPKENGTKSASSGRLSKVSCMGMTMLKYSYDSANRLTGISGEYLEGDRVTVTYSPEMIVTVEEWEDGHDEWTEDGESYYVPAGHNFKSVWTEIEMNDQGYITKLKETDYTKVNGFWQLDEDDPVSWLTFNYDSDGYLTSFIDADGYPNVWNWSSDGLLLSAKSDDMIFQYQYDDQDLLNPNGQWSADNGPLTYWMPTNWFGKGPSKFPTSATMIETWDEVNLYSENIQWAYALNKSNYISSVKESSDGDVVTLSYSYDK